VRLRKIYNKAKDRFRNLYKKICGANEKRKDCGVDLVSRKRIVCFTKYLCLVKYAKKILGKRSIDSQGQIKATILLRLRWHESKTFHRRYLADVFGIFPAIYRMSSYDVLEARETSNQQNRRPLFDVELYT
jgi:hypothetical protein